MGTDMAPTIANEEAMLSYTSYDLQWLGPIVLPLSFALPAIAYVLYGYWKTGVKTSADVVSLGITIIEAMFAVFCWVQCIANFHNRDMSGGADACYFQAIYATWYLFTSILLVTMAAVVTVKDISITSAAVGTTVLYCIGMFLAVLPYMGAGQYRFPKDFCMADLEQGVYAGLWLAAWLIGGLMLAAAVAMSSRGHVVMVCGSDWGVRMVKALMVAAYLAFFTTPTIIDLIYLSDGQQPGTIYGALAIILHLQQVCNPLLYGLVWRHWLNSYGDEEAKGSSDEDLIDQNTFKYDQEKLIEAQYGSAGAQDGTQSGSC